jgi:hypothetical protein
MDWYLPGSDLWVNLFVKYAISFPLAGLFSLHAVLGVSLRTCGKEVAKSGNPFVASILYRSLILPAGSGLPMAAARFACHSVGAFRLYPLLSAKVQEGRSVHYG